MSEEEAGGNEQTGLVLDMHGARMTMDLARIQTYNFRNPGFLSQTQLRQFGLIHEKLAQHLSARLSTFLRMDCVVKIGAFQSASFAQFCEGLAHPTHLELFQVESLRGVGILEMSLPLGLAMADRLLGGKGRADSPARVLSEIETTLLQDAVLLVLGEWAQLLETPDRKMRAQCIGTETSGRFLQTAPPDAPFMALQMEVGFGETRESMQIGIPFSMLELFIKRLQRNGPIADEIRPRQVQWRAPFEGIHVPIRAEWKVRAISLGEVLALQLGDVIPLAAAIVQDTRISYSENGSFSGTVGVQNGYLAVQLREKISNT